ncbi:thiopurine S-methyltransferase [Mariprofundus ferrooxydans]|uniref:thiopurine S-methyltransferase n=1 Tax=Mariprofundus ferrooxydans TaxID=314344 RepID=UPI00142F82F5|nr:thiopurine S-methyltransferase [Mariprofundus ferrooxydans]
MAAKQESGADNQLWIQSWRDRRIDFHQSVVNPLMKQFWPSLKLAPGSRVFVPLCGKSLDMTWLAQQGHNVIGVELSAIAVKAFFRENGLRPVKRKVGQFTLWRHGRLSILCGDYFALSKAEIGAFDMVYDRAALTALSEHDRRLYVAQLTRLVPENIRVMLLTIEDAAEDATLSQAVGVDTEITSLFSAGFDIDLAFVDSAFEIDPDSPDQAMRRAEYKVYQLTAKTTPG